MVNRIHTVESIPHIFNEPCSSEEGITLTQDRGAPVEGTCTNPRYEQSNNGDVVALEACCYLMCLKNGTNGMGYTYNNY